MSLDYRWENKINQRYYRLVLSQDLFGEWILTRVWGGIGKATGRITHLPCTSYQEGVKQIERLAKIRLQRGYDLVVANI